MTRQQFEYHPVVGFRFVPGVRARFQHESGGYLVRANAQGFRCDRDFEVARQGSTRRVLVFGDSFTAGVSVSNGKRYSDVLESLLPDTECYNFGLPGSGTDQQYLAWREFARGIEHDVLVIAVLVENVRRNLARYRPFLDDQGKMVLYAKPYFAVDSGGELSLHHCPPERLPVDEAALSPAERATIDRSGRFERLRIMVRGLGLQQWLQRFTRYQPVPEYDSPKTPGWRLMSAILSRWVREHGDPSRVVIMPIPLYQHVEGTASSRAYRTRFSQLCASLGCVMHDLLPDLQKYSQEERRRFRFPVDVHPTVEGHAAIAGSVAPTIASMLARPSGTTSNLGVRAP
jgi:lysophospholipase L1-like esterase